MTQLKGHLELRPPGDLGKCQTEPLLKGDLKVKTEHCGLGHLFLACVRAFVELMLLDH